jgi:fatty acyl-CoA reductase
MFGQFVANINANCPVHFSVLSSINEPLSGWVDNFNGPTGIVSAVGKGLFRTILCKEHCVADLIPVDIVINLMIVSAWRTANEKKHGITIYNCCTGLENPITWGNFVTNCIEAMRKHPLGKFDLLSRWPFA